MKHDQADLSWVVAALKGALARLSSGAPVQIEYLRSHGIAPLADELALELQDLVSFLPQLVESGVLDSAQAQLVMAVDDKLAHLSRRHDVSLWTEDALRNRQEWKEVRNIASSAQAAL